MRNVILIASAIVVTSAVAVSAFSAGYATGTILYKPIVTAGHPSHAQRQELTRLVGKVLRHHPHN